MSNLYLRHPNGNGKLFDDSECCEVSNATKDSVIKNHASVWNSKIINSRIYSSTITNAEIHNSHIIRTLVAGGLIKNSFVKCEIITGDTIILNSHILGASRIAHRAKLTNVRVANLTVKGEAVLENWHNTKVFNGLFGYVSRGIWQRPPKVLRLACGFTVTESIPKFAYVGCYEYEIAHWLKIGEKYGQVFGLTKQEIDEIRQFLVNLH